MRINFNALFTMLALFALTVFSTACSDGQSLGQDMPSDLEASGQVEIVLHFDLLPDAEIPFGLEMIGYHFPTGKTDESVNVPFSCSAAQTKSLTCSVILPQSREVHFMAQTVDSYGKHAAVCSGTDWQSCAGYVLVIIPSTGDKPEIVLVQDDHLSGVAYKTLIPRSHL